MRLSLCVDPCRSWPQVLALAQRADMAGWHAVYVCDHFMPHDPAGRAVGGPVLECWTILAALATRTSAVRLGSLVLGNTYRHPAAVATMAATLDQISGGRLVLGIGAGWQPNEHRAYGIPLPPARDRIASLDDACAVIGSLLGQRVPLLVGGGGRRTLQVAARHADVWHCWAAPAKFALKNAVLDQLCQDAGRRPSDVARACGGTVAVRASGSAVRAAGHDDVQGTPEEVLSHLLAFRHAGAGEFIVRDAVNVPIRQVLAQIDILAQDVVPQLTP